MTDEHIGLVVITPREIYNEVVGLRADIQAVTNALPKHREDLDDHEDRIRDLEKSKWKLPSIAAAVSAVLSGGGATALQQILTNGA